MSAGKTYDEAKAALDEIERGHRQVVAEVDMPRWYWWGLALGWVGLGIITDLGHVWLSAVATFAFGAIHASVAHVALAGRHRTPQLSVRADVAGRHTPLLAILALAGLAVLTVFGAVAAAAAGLDHPVTVVSVVVAVAIVVGGPRLMAAVRARASRSSAAAW